MNIFLESSELKITLLANFRQKDLGTRYSNSNSLPFCPSVVMDSFSHWFYFSTHCNYLLLNFHLCISYVVPYVTNMHLLGFSSIKADESYRHHLCFFVLIFLRIDKCILKVPKREIFDRSDFPDFYTIKSSWVGDLLVKILN